MNDNDSQDAMGMMLADCLSGNDAKEIIERDDGNIDVGPGGATYLANYEEWPEVEQLMMGYVKGRVLDIGCGGGRHSLYLQEQGHAVLGIDNSPLAIKVCRQRGLKEAQLMPITKVNSAIGLFETIIMMGNNFGLMANQKRAHWLLRRFYQMTPEDGRIITCSRDPYVTDDPAHLAYHDRNRTRGRMSGQVRIRVRYHQYKTPWFDYLLVSQDEMVQLLEGTNWQATKFINSDLPTYGAIIEKVA